MLLNFVPLLKNIIIAQNNLALVTGANGHLGNNLVRLLINKGIPVRASVRNLKNKEPFLGLDCEVVQSDISDKQSLINALQGVETFYAVGAVFKLWAKDSKKRNLRYQYFRYSKYVRSSSRSRSKTNCLCEFNSSFELHITSNKGKLWIQSRQKRYVLQFKKRWRSVGF